MSLYLGSQKIGNLGETFTPREIQSVNRKTAVQGNITVYGSDTQISEADHRTVADALSGLSSIVLSGTFEDSSEFNFEVLIKV